MDRFDQERETRNREELIDLIGRHTPKEGANQPMDDLWLIRFNGLRDRLAGTLVPSLCLIAQGAKVIYVGESSYRYDPDHFLIASLELPMTGKVIEASSEKPYLALLLNLDPTHVGSVMIDSGLTAPARQSDAKAVYVSDTDPSLLDAVVRLLRVLDSPEDQAVLVPMLKREIVYRLLVGEQGHRLRNLPTLGAHSNRIMSAVDKIRRDYREQISIESLARDLGMSMSGFHHHFKSIMDMSPLQFRKLLRLQEARRLMLGESQDAATTAYLVGYEDPSHFSRDYKRQYGDAPIRDVSRLRERIPR